MIVFNNVEKWYGKRKIYGPIKSIIKENGIYAICGPSGCGKSTLLNNLCGLDNNYYGNITYDDIDLKLLNEEERKKFRINNFSFIFQSYNLFEDETVYNNIFLVQDAFNDLTKENKEENIKEILSFLGIEKISSELVKNLSGGEKQRVAIARALANNSKIVFCDEPTGALDEINSEHIFNILKEISKQKIVFLVSHSEKDIKKYADYIFNFKDNTFKKNEDLQVFHKKSDIFINYVTKRNKRDKLNFKFIFNSIKNTFKSKKMRYIFSSFIFSISLICFGISLYMSTSLSSSIENTFGDVIGNNSLILRKKNIDEQVQLYSLSNEDLSKVKDKYDIKIDRIGIKYLSDLIRFFPDQNAFYYENSFDNAKINFLNATSINEFKLIRSDLIDRNKLYPRDLDITSLKNDEIVLGINYKTLQEICEELQIPKEYDDLEKHILLKGFNLIFKIKNNSWSYYDEHLFKVKGILATSENMLYHSNEKFNEYVFENLMMLPSTTDMNSVSEIPWLLKKITYVKTKDFQTNFINEISKDDEFKNYLFEPDNYLYSPKICTVDKLCRSNQVFIFKTLEDIFHSSITNEVRNINNDFSNFYYSTNYGYSNYGNDIFNGFGMPLYFSFSKDLINEIERNYEKIYIDDYKNAVLNDKISQGYYLNTDSQNVRFSTLKSEVIEGNKELKIGEIGISSALANKLKINDKVLYENLYLMLNYSQESDGKYLFNKFKTIKLKVTSIINSNEMKIYHNKEFTLYLFRDFFEISSLNLISNAVVYEFNEKPNDLDIQKINSLITGYELIDPFKPFSDSIDTVFKYFNIGLLIFASLCSFSTLILIFVINTINFEEEKKNYAILNMIGFSKKQVYKLQIFKNFSYVFPSLISSIFSLIIISYFLNMTLSSAINLNTVYKFPFLSILGIAIITLLITLFSFLFTIKNFKKKNYIDLLH